MKLEQLKYFICIVDCHSFNQAAKKLYISQPALTTSIKTLEKELDVILLKRSNKGIYPTEAGQALYDDFKEILDAAETRIATWLNATQVRSNSNSMVNITAIPALCTFLLNNIFFDMQRHFPEIKLSVYETAMFGFCENFIHSKANIGLVAVKKDHLSQNDILKSYHKYGLNYQVLLEDEYMLGLSVKNPLAQKSELTLNDLQKLRWITYSRQDSLAAKELLDKSITVGKYKEALYLNSYDSILQAVCNDLGYSLFLKSSYLNNWYVRNKLLCLKKIVGMTIAPSEHHLVWSDESLLTDNEKDILAYLQQHYVSVYYQALAQI